jgi:putative DNA-binding protein
MAHPKEIREKLRRLYVSDGQTLEIAAMMCEIPTATARSWKRAAKETGDDWDKVRAAYTLAGGGIEDLAARYWRGFWCSTNRR